VEERNRLSKVAELITGFESPYGLELLATIDYLIKENNTFDAKIITEQLWSERKRKMFSNEHIDMAISHLLAYRKDLYPSTAEITN
jgi:flagellar biosynthesis regulator FlbT